MRYGLPSLQSRVEGTYVATAGEVIAGKYRIEREIGRGGMGLVLLATHVDLEQPVAVKVLHDDAAYDADAIARFIREARAAGKIQSDHVARVMDTGVLPEGGAYIVMELLDGKDLADVLRDEGPLDVEVAVGHLLEACDGVAAAHAVGIVHRDLKPANLFLAKKPDDVSIVKVLDFGVSKILATPNAPRSPSTLTQSGQIFGSPSYMAPEQLRSATDVDARADIWSLGVVLYELITGRLPFPTRSMADMMAAIVRDPPLPLAQVLPDAPDALEDIVARCLEKEPQDRFTSVAELARALAPFAPEKETLVARIERISGKNAAGGVPSIAAPTSVRVKASDLVEGSTARRRARVEAPPDLTGESSLSRSLRGARAPSSSGRSRWGIVIATALAATLGLSVMLSRRAPVLTTEPAPTGAPAPAPTPDPKAAVAPAESERVPATSPASAAPAAAVTINVSSAPNGTRVYRGDELVGTVPGPVVLPRGDKPVELRFVAEGYTPAVVPVVPNLDRVLAVDLQPTKPASRPPKGGGRTKLPGDLEPF